MSSAQVTGMLLPQIPTPSISSHAIEAPNTPSSPSPNQERQATTATRLRRSIASPVTRRPTDSQLCPGAINGDDSAGPRATLSPRHHPASPRGARSAR